MSVYFEGYSFAEVYQQLLYACLINPDAVCKPRGMEIRELISPSIRVLNPLDRFYTSMPRSTPMRYAAGEFLWYFSLRNDPEFIVKYSSFWNQLKNETSAGPLNEGKLNSSYGELTMGPNWKDASWGKEQITQWEWALWSIRRDSDSRQAIIHVNRPAHQVSWIKDFPCTILFQFLLRDNKVHMIVTMRSNDLIKGLTFDFPMFSFFQEQFRADLQSLVGGSLELGHLTLTAGSSHIYSRDFVMVNEMLESGIDSMGPIAPLTPTPFIELPNFQRVHSDEFKALLAFAEFKEEITLNLSPVYKAFAESLRETN